MRRIVMMVSVLLSSRRRRRELVGTDCRDDGRKWSPMLTSSLDGLFDFVSSSLSISIRSSTRLRPLRYLLIEAQKPWRWSVWSKLIAVLQRRARTDMNAPPSRHSSTNQVRQHGRLRRRLWLCRPLWRLHERWLRQQSRRSSSCL